jgi:hypothetical protein
MRLHGEYFHSVSVANGQFVKFLLDRKVADLVKLYWTM